MCDVLTGIASVTDFGRVRAGDVVTVVVDGWQAERLALTVTGIKSPLDHHTATTWLYGADAGGRVRLVLARCAPPPAIGRASVRRASEPALYPSLWDSDGIAHQEEEW